ncbi:putative phosphodiesterase I [Helianthus anomalus]
MKIQFCFIFVTFLTSFTSIPLTHATSRYYRTLAGGHRQGGSTKFNEQPLAEIAIYEAVLALHEDASVKASPNVLGLKGEDTEWVTIQVDHPEPSPDDWIAVFSPAQFNGSTCSYEDYTRIQPPYICSSPIKFMNVSYENPDYVNTGKSSLRLQIINQRSDFSFALFSGGYSKVIKIVLIIVVLQLLAVNIVIMQPELKAVSNTITFANPKAPLYPRLALGKSWDEVTFFFFFTFNFKLSSCKNLINLDSIWLLNVR